MRRTMAFHIIRQRSLGSFPMPIKPTTTTIIVVLATWGISPKSNQQSTILRTWS